MTAAEADQIVAALQEAAENGANLVVMTDDAYFGLFYGADLAQESLFARLANLHERILAVKVDGPTKEEFVWGLRTGMLTFGTRAATSNEALVPGAGKEGRRGDPQRGLQLFASLAERARQGPIDGQRSRPNGAEKQGILRDRAQRVHEILKKPEFARYWDAYPFNAGYFMCVRLKGIDAETFRKHLVGEVRRGRDRRRRHDIRVAFSAVEIGELEDLFSLMGAAAKDLVEAK